MVIQQVLLEFGVLYVDFIFVIYNHLAQYTAEAGTAFIIFRIGQYIVSTFAQQAQWQGERLAVLVKGSRDAPFAADGLPLGARSPDEAQVGNLATAVVLYHGREVEVAHSDIRNRGHRTLRGLLGKCVRVHLAVPVGYERAQIIGRVGLQAGNTHGEAFCSHILRDQSLVCSADFKQLVGYLHAIGRDT